MQSPRLKSVSEITSRFENLFTTRSVRTGVKMKPAFKIGVDFSFFTAKQLHIEAQGRAAHPGKQTFTPSHTLKGFHKTQV